MLHRKACKLAQSIRYDGKVGWTDGTAGRIRQRAAQVLEKLTGAVADTGEAESSVPEFSSAPEQRNERLAAWLQFPRRVVLLLVAFGAALGLIVGLRGPLGNMGGARLPVGLESQTGRRAKRPGR